MFRRLVNAVIVMAITCCAVTVAPAADVAQVHFIRHDLRVTLDVPGQSAQISDRGTCHVTAGWNLFLLSNGAGIDSCIIDGTPVTVTTANLNDTASLPAEIHSKLPELKPEGKPLLVFFHSKTTGPVLFRLVFHSVFNDDVSHTRFSNENVGREVAGTILKKGAYLSPAAYYYPQGDEETFQCRVTVDIPAAWESISDGNRLSSETINGRKVQTWENPFASDGVMLMAAPYVTKSRMTDSIEVACYFFPDDTGLFDSYLDATVGYIEMYSQLIGAYPFRRFTVAENFFPTGYGMPAWTLLGQQVLRLPFIKYTSLGHEVLHNWWGNSVYVDYERGNWCEAATVYGADYRYKLLRSPADARAYRKDILKQYVSYVNEQNDFPIREFRSRTSPNTRTIGYNKAMMVYHMIEQVIGTERFFKTWQRIYAEYRGKRISWEEWIQAFEQASGHYLSYIIPQWIDRAGAPVLGLRIDDVAAGHNSDTTQQITFSLTESSGQQYRLKVPLRFADDGTAMDTTVILNSPESSYVIIVPETVTTLTVDPEYDLFRRLYPEEIEPIVSMVMGIQDKRFVSFVADSATNTQFAACGYNMTDDSVTVIPAQSLPGDTTIPAAVVLNPSDFPSYLAEKVKIRGDSLLIDGTAYPRQGHTFILAGQDWKKIGKYLVVLTSDPGSLPRIGQLVPHYGKYSYLVFAGTHNVGKGHWPAGSSPLRGNL